MSRNLCPVTSGHDLYSSVLPAKGHSRARRSQYSQSTNNIDLRALVIATCEILRFRFTAFVLPCYKCAVINKHIAILDQS